MFSDKSQMASKCGKNISDTLGCTFLSLSHFDVVCDLLLNRRTAYTRTAFLKCPCVQKFIDRLDLRGLDPGKSDVKGSLA